MTTMVPPDGTCRHGARRRFHAPTVVTVSRWSASAFESLSRRKWNLREHNLPSLIHRRQEAAGAVVLSRRQYPPAAQTFQHGHSLGHWEGKT
jgi:hypothetical protein